MRGPGRATVPARVPLTGDFNVANALCAIAALRRGRLRRRARSPRRCGRSGGVPGRLEQVDAGQDFLAVVDYAHKPDAVAGGAGRAAAADAQAGWSWCIGAGGDRDPGKRPMMGEIAARLADVLVVTDDNPRSEDPAAIRAELMPGPRRAGRRARRGARGR